jgi:beta-lactamase superfamily II metal-dependent hydrolase
MAAYCLDNLIRDVPTGYSTCGGTMAENSPDRRPAGHPTRILGPLLAAMVLALGVGAGPAQGVGSAPTAAAGRGLHGGPQRAGGLDIYWIDVEGGAATLVVTPAGESILMDTGWPGTRDAERIARTAAQAGLKRIDHLVTTHWHTDHFGGVEALAGRMPIGRYYDHGFPAGNPPDITPALKDAYLRATGGRSTVLRPGDELTLRQDPGAREVSARVVAAGGLVEGEPPTAPQTRPCGARPEHPALPDDESDNFRSVGLLVRYGGFRFLDLGDLTWNVEHKLVCPRNRLGKVDVYQVTHHGLDVSNNPALLEAIRAQVAIVNNGPKKGGKAVVFRRLLEAPGSPDVFQVHRNVESSAGENAPPERVANDAEACEGRGLHVGVERGARRFTVDVAGKASGRAYEVR